jgi:hypothetical protein
MRRGAAVTASVASMPWALERLKSSIRSISFNHLVGAGEHRRRNFKPECLDRITISSPKSDGIYIVEFKTAAGEALAISVPSGETMADCDVGGGSSGTDARPNGVRNVPRASAHRPRRAAWRRNG